MTKTDLAMSYADISAARERIAPYARVTPVLTSTTANRLTGAEIFFKAENFQRIGAFKFRGACNAISQFTPGQKQAGVVAYSSGNHAQAVALAAKLHGVPATIVMPIDAPASKREATENYGATIIEYDRYSEDREKIAGEIAEKAGAVILPPYNHPDIMAGQGTAAAELFGETGDLDVLIVPLGGGGLLSGSAVAARALSPKCRVIGVEPEAGNDAQRSLAEGRIIHIDTPRTIADGAQTQHLGDLTFPVLRDLVDEVVTVTDAELVDQMRFFAERMKIVVEPTGCLAAAAAFTGKIDIKGKRVGIIISGGNVGMDRYAELVGGRSV